MIDPYFFEDDIETSDMTEDDLFGAAEEYFYDTYDQIIDENELEEQHLSDLDENDLDAFESGAAFAFADMMREENYDVDENTDRENWDKVMSRAPLSSRHEASSNLRPFEQYVQNYIRRGFKHPD